MSGLIYKTKISLKRIIYINRLNTQNMIVILVDLRNLISVKNYKYNIDDKIFYFIDNNLRVLRLHNNIL